MNTRATTHGSGSDGAGRVPPDPPGKGLSRDEIDRMVSAANGIIADCKDYPDWRIADACDTILLHSSDHAIRNRAARLKQVVSPDRSAP